jgi:DNA-binding winged helix-turn-helix (wHTH) protein/Tfp pilus assembly protein PilF
MRRVPEARVLHFDVFALDLGRCVLRQGEKELPLRPKSFDVLRYLAEHPNRLVSKEELLDAVWPGIAVTEGSLVQCVRDIRQALGDSDHRIIETVPKRGYFLAASISETAPNVDAVGSTTVIVGEQSAELPRPVAPVAASRLQFRDIGLRARPRLWIAFVVVVATAALAATMYVPATLPPNANAAHFAMLGRATLEKERSPAAYKDALAYFDRALAIDPNNVQALLGYARVMVVNVTEGWAHRHERRSRLDQAQVAIDRAIAVGPRNYYAHYMRGVMLRARGEPEQAIAALDRALALNPNHAFAHAERGRILIDLGRVEETVAQIEKAISLDPTERDIAIWYFWAGTAALHAGKSEEALGWLLKARSYRFTSPALAIAYAEVGRENEARGLIADYMARRPGFSIWQLQQDFRPPHNAAVAARRMQMLEVFRRLGVPEGRVQTGSTQ